MTEQFDLSVMVAHLLHDMGEVPVPVQRAAPTIARAVLQRLMAKDGGTYLPLVHNAVVQNALREAVSVYQAARRAGRRKHVRLRIPDGLYISFQPRARVFRCWTKFGRGKRPADNREVRP